MSTLIKRLTIFSGIWFSLACISLVALTQSAQAAPATFTVTNTNDSGAGSLRQAIQDANTNGNPGDQDVIEFDIPGEGSQRITTESTLSITQSVLINGYTQPGTSPNTVDFPYPMDGLINIEIVFHNDGEMEITASSVTLQGLAMFHSDGNNRSITLDGADNFAMYGSYYGPDYTGIGAEGYSNLEIVDSQNVTIGGTLPAQRNVIGGCLDVCIEISATNPGDSDNIDIIGNNIGIGADSILSLGDGNGIPIQINPNVTDVSIGVDEASGGNFFSTQEYGAINAVDTDELFIYGNIFAYNKSVANEYPSAVVILSGVTNGIVGSTTETGMNYFTGSAYGGGLIIKDSETQSSFNVFIEGNTFGYMYESNVPFPNEGAGLLIKDSSDTVRISQNIIHNSRRIGDFESNYQGISVADEAQNVSIVQNSIYDNAGLGIDLNNNNIVETNDDNDSDTGPNQLLNSPGYTQVIEDGGNTEVTFTLDVPAGDYRIEFYSNTDPDPSGFGEGETFLGYTDITHAGEGLEEFLAIVSGTGHNNLALTATLIDDESPTGYGPTSEFGAEGEPYVPPLPVIDLQLEKTLLNPEDVALGNTLDYQITITNAGPDSFDLIDFNDPSPGDNVLFYDILPPQLAYSGISDSNITCINLGPGSAVGFGPALANHSDHGVVSCGYTGGNYVLNAGESITFTLSAEIVDDSNLAFTNHAIAWHSPWESDMSTYAAISNNIGVLGDLIDGAIGTNYNNYSSAYSQPIDTETTLTLLNPESLEVGGQAQYSVVVRNNGPGPLDLTGYDLSGNPFATNLFWALLPANLTYVSQSNSDINCIGGAPGSAGSAVVFPNHAADGILLCGYAGALTSLGSGEAIETTITLDVDSLPDGFTAYALGGVYINESNNAENDYLPIFSAYMIAFDGGDLVDELLDGGSINNFASAVYNAPDDEEEPPVDGEEGGNSDNNSGDSSGGGNSQSGNSNDLADTGRNILLGMLIGILLIAGVVGLYRFKNKHA